MLGAIKNSIVFLKAPIAFEKAYAICVTNSVGFFYKRMNIGVDEQVYEAIASSISNRFGVIDNVKFEIIVLTYSECNSLFHSILL